MRDTLPAPTARDDETSMQLLRQRASEREGGREKMGEKKKGKGRVEKKKGDPGPKCKEITVEGWVSSGEQVGKRKKAKKKNASQTQQKMRLLLLYIIKKDKITTAGAA